MTMRHVLAMLLLLLAPPARAQDGGTAALLDSLRADHGFVAIGLAYQRGPSGEPIVLQAGVTDSGGNLPVPAHAAWHIGSITKGFTATLLMMLAEDGVIDLDAPLADLLPGAQMHPDWAGLRLPALLSHTAGTPPDFPLPLLIGRPTSDLIDARDQALALSWSAPLPGPHGEVAYSNLGVTLAGHVAEVAAGAPWESLILSRIAGPLGLTTLGFGAPQGPDAIRGHREGAAGLTAVDPASPFADNSALMAPAGAIHLSLADLVRWGRFQLDACRGLHPDLLSAEGCARLHRVVVDPMALGFVHFTLPGRVEPVIGHDGSNTLWFAYLMLFPEQDLVLAVAVNDGRPGPAAEAAVTLADHVLSLAP
jgi:D-alanyl-D-alanine carboxypeptidase